MFCLLCLAGVLTGGPAEGSYQTIIVESGMSETHDSLSDSGEDPTTISKSGEGAMWLSGWSTFTAELLVANGEALLLADGDLHDESGVVLRGGGRFKIDDATRPVTEVTISGVRDMTDADLSVIPENIRTHGGYFWVQIRRV